jgi:hypothetical protein
LEELDIFNSFAASGTADIDAGSGVNRPSPEPDIYCTVLGAGCYFELGEITDRPVSKSMAAAMKRDEITGCAFSQDRPLEHIVKKKAGRKYQTSGRPVDLLLYYRTQPAPPRSHFAELLQQNMPLLNGLVVGGQFRLVWVFDFTKKVVLWHSLLTGKHFPVRDICRCIV